MGRPEKSAGIIAALLLADGRIPAPSAPLWATLACAAALTLGASAGGWASCAPWVASSSVVGVGGGRRRWHYVRWEVVRRMSLAWLVTMPATAALAALVPLAGDGRHERRGAA